MDRTTALEWLKSSDSHKRLQAARFFSRNARAADRAALVAALTNENIVWVRSALSKAIDTSCTLTGIETTPIRSKPFADDSEFDADNVYAEAIEETTNRLVHEIEPILGTARLYAQKEISDYENSRTREQLDRLHSLVRAIDKLSRAAAPAVNKEFNLSELIQNVANSEKLRHEINIEIAGPQPLIVIGDLALVEIALTNGLRNAMEAMEEHPPLMDSTLNRIVMNWGETDRDYWVSIIDHGPGLPVGMERVWDIGTTTKSGHSGMGLALAHRAVLSLGGKIMLRPRPEKGSLYEFRWPRNGK